MNNVICDTCKDPLGAMMLDYLYGNQDAYVEVESTTLEMSTMRGEIMFREYPQMSGLERRALALCEGRILDVGAGSGCHSLYLQDRKRDVDALDISPGCIRVMQHRKVKNVLHKNLFALSGEKYTTILMLMNGLGICGSIAGLHVFLQYVKTLLAEGGQVIADSTDLTPLYEDAKEHLPLDIYYGETEFIIKFQTIVSEPFQWLYVDFTTLQTLADVHGLQCEQLVTGQRGHYLVRIF